MQSKSMVAGVGADTAMLLPVQVEDCTIDMVEDYQYFGSSISSDGELTTELSGCLDTSTLLFLLTCTCLLTLTGMFMLLLLWLPCSMQG